MEKTNNTRTTQQNSALHLYFDLLAKEFQKEGITMTTILQKFIVDTPATKTTIKELMWKPLQSAILEKDSTTKLLKQEEIDLIYDSLNKFTSETFGISVPFPSYENIVYQSEDIKGGLCSKCGIWKGGSYGINGRGEQSYHICK